MSFSVDTEIYSGPLELLLHLVRREELPLAEISLRVLTEQYFNYLEVLVELDLDDVAEFLEIASILIEMKAKQAVPTADVAPTEEEQTIDDPTDQLVQRLVDYKRIRDAASLLDENSRRWQLRYARMSNDLPVRRLDPGTQPIESIEVWDLVSAFGRILREREAPPQASVIHDDTPIHVYMQRIHQQVLSQPRVELGSLFEAGMHKSTLVAMFLATLELTRHYGLSTEQSEAGQPLYLLAGPEFKQELDVHKIDNLSFERVLNSNMPVTPR
ncbi:MAG: segregation/condensation protein A [Pirellulaceae bacterium]|nr:segregation/condensation protein A [Pirellulaceae bacterium]